MKFFQAFLPINFVSDADITPIRIPVLITSKMYISEVIKSYLFTAKLFFPFNFSFLLIPQQQMPSIDGPWKLDGSLSHSHTTKMLTGQEAAGWKAGLRSETNFCKLLNPPRFLNALLHTHTHERAHAHAHAHAHVYIHADKHIHKHAYTHTRKHAYTILSLSHTHTHA